MQKITFLIGLFFIGVMPAVAQKFEGGLFAGATTTQVNGDGLAGFDMAGFQSGFFTQYRIGSKSLLQLEVAFTQKGAREPESDTSTFYRLRANYINVPLLISYRVGQLSFEAGPALDILVNAKEEDISGERPTDDRYRLNTFSLVGVAGVNYYFSKRFYINFRSTISVTPMRDGFADVGRPYLLQAGGNGQRNLLLSTALYYSFLD